MAFMISFFGTFYENLNTMLVVVTVKLLGLNLGQKSCLSPIF